MRFSYFLKILQLQPKTYHPSNNTFFTTFGFLAAGMYYLTDHFQSQLRNLQIKEKRLPQYQIVFQQFSGEYSDAINFSSEFDESFEQFTHSKIGILICYLVNDNQKSKAIAGRIIDKQDQQLVNTFLEKNKNFKLVTLPEVKSAQVDIPLHTFLQAPSFIAENVTYKLLNYVMRKKKDDFIEDAGVTIISDGKQMIKYAIPLGKDAAKYNLFSLQSEEEIKQ